jgi:hypothetical protein
MRQQGLKKLEYDEAPDEGTDTLLPAQFWAALADPRTEPEKRLMVAVLEEAIALVVNDARGGGDGRRTAVRDAQRWFASDDSSTPFAFATICDVLGIDVGRVRQALARWPRRQRTFRRPRLQAGRGRHQVRTGQRGPRRAA